MKLFIAEKPSLAKAIAEALPGESKQSKGFIRCGNDTIVTWLFGHVLQQAPPDAYGDEFKQWSSIKNGPIVPEKWKLLISPKAKDQFKIVSDLCKDKNVTEIVHAGDPDREGQLLVDEFLEYIGNRKTVVRFLGGNNLESSAINNALKEMKNNRHYEGMKKSAQARQRADWLIGMNGTRLFTLLMQSKGYDGVSNIGRVKTPVMSMIVSRINEINNFKPVKHFQIKGIYSKDKSFMANWQMPSTINGLDDEGRLIDKSVADAVMAKLQSSNLAKVTNFKTEDKKEKHPLCYNLSNLQIKANQLYKYKPDNVLEIVQGLYEQKILTYPRSDCPYLPESQHQEATEILNKLRKTSASFAVFLDKTDTKIVSKTWDSKKAPVHHAIIPTKTDFDYNKLNEKERNIYDLVAIAYVAQFLPMHEYKQTDIEIDQCGEKFKATGRITVKAGWRELFGKEDADDDSSEDNNQVLPVLNIGDTLKVENNQIVEKTTSPPKPFTLGTIVKAMVNIDKYVTNKEIKKILKETQGIGTDATRANILKELIENLIEVRGKKEELYPTPKAQELYNILPDELKLPDTTALWEMTLNGITESNSDIQPFIDKQVSFVTGLIGEYKDQIKTVPRPYNNVTAGNNTKNKSKPAQQSDKKTKKCPKCKDGKLIERKGSNGVFYGCSNYPACKHSESK